MERRGAVVRQPHAIHGRIQQLTLSKIGRRLLADFCRVRAAAADVERDLATDITPTEELTVRRWLVTIAA